MIMHDILEEPYGTLYNRLLTIATYECRIALLVIRESLPCLSALCNVALTQLRPYLISEGQAIEWPGTSLIDHSATVLRYRYTPSSVSQFQLLSDHLYGWQYPDLPEDLCLLRADESPFLVTIAHERDSYLLLTPEEHIVISTNIPDLRIS